LGLTEDEIIKSGHEAGQRDREIGESEQKHPSTSLLRKREVESEKAPSTGEASCFARRGEKRPTSCWRGYYRVSPAYSPAETNSPLLLKFGLRGPG
jgi:hypothetical protein